MAELLGLGNTLKVWGRQFPLRGGSRREFYFNKLDQKGKENKGN